MQRRPQPTLLRCALVDAIGGEMPIRLPIFDPFEYLVRRKFPSYKALQIPPSLRRGGMSHDEREQRLAEIEAYEGELKNSLSKN